LWNVALGQLAFIGPRPERPVFVEKLSKDVPLFKLRTLVRPGITGWAQVHQGYANSVEDSRHKLELDLFYIMTNSVALDIQVILMTISLILFSGGTEGKKRRSGGVITRKRSFYSNYLARKPEAPSPIQLATITDIGRAKSSYRN
jgi:hypothetical protein